jgi:HAE1 family hydrophobic/amphiphilic exporter-1
MGLPDLSTSRPITFLMLFIAIVAIGAVSLSSIKIDLYPNIDLPTVSIVTTYQGVSPEDIETLITKPIEESVASVEDVDEITSASREGLSLVTVKFKWGKDMDVASLDVREAVDFVKPFLPDDADEPFIFKFSTSAMPVLFLGLGGNHTLPELKKLSEEQVEPRLERIPGVAAVYTQGGREREIHVYADDEKLEAYGLGLDDLVRALAAANVRVPGGTIEQGKSDFLVRTSGEFASVREIAAVMVTRTHGSPVYLRDVADVEDSFADRTEELRLGGRPGVMVMIQKQSTANTVDVSDRVKAALPDIEKTLDVKFITFMDSAKYIKQSIGNLRSVALEGAALAVVVLLLFLWNFPSTLIIATSIPISVVATFIVMRSFNITLNMISMGGLALGIGMLVDSSIVVLENIYRHRERGLTRKEAAVYGAGEVATAITASVLTTVAVFLPVVFVPGIAGIMFRDMALTVVFALLSSLFVALSLIPLLASRVLSVSKRGGGRRTTGKLGGTYDAVLRWALRHRKTTVVITIVLFLLSISLVRFVGVEFISASQPGEFQLTVEMPVGTRLDVTERAVIQAEDIVKKNVPEIESMFARVGQGTGFGAIFGSAGTHTGTISFQVVPLNKRKRTDEQIRLALNKPLTQVPGAKVYFSSDAFSQMFFGGARLAVEIYGQDLTIARTLAETVRDSMEAVYGATDVRISREEGKPESRIKVDEVKAASFGLPVSTIANSVQTAVMGTVAGQYREAGKEFNIRVRLPDDERQSLEDLMDILVPTPMGNPVPLSAVASMEVQGGPVEIERKDQQRLVTVTGNLTGERDLGSVVNDLREKLARIPVPPDFAVQVAGEAQEVQESFRWLALALLGAVFLVYMVMASQFESLRHPFIIMFSLPLSFIGVAWMLFITGTTLSINSLIGVIVLAGIVVNNAILLVDYTNLLRARGMVLEDAVMEAARVRRRPILMTAFTTMLAMTPMALGLGEGSELNAPMARSVIGGLATSTFLTLVIIPVIYMMFETFRDRFAKKTDE